MVRSPNEQEELCADVLRASIVGDWDAVQDAVNKIFDEDLFTLALIIWADQYLMALYPEWTPDVGMDTEIQGIDYHYLANGAVTTQQADVDNVPPSVAWVGRWIAARAAMDKDNADALLGVLHATNAEHDGFMEEVVNIMVTSTKAVLLMRVDINAQKG